MRLLQPFGCAQGKKAAATVACRYYGACRGCTAQETSDAGPNLGCSGRIALAGGFIEKNRCGGGGVQRFDSAGHGNTDARIGAVLDLFGQASAFVAHEQSDRLAPIDFPGSEQALLKIFIRLVDAGSQRADACDLELREKNRKGHPRKDGKMQCCPGGSAQRFRREWARGTADARSGGGGAGRAERGSGAQDGSDVSGILDTGEDDEQGSAGGFRGAHEIIEGSFARMNQRGYSLRVFGVGKTFEEAVGGAEDGKSHFGPVDEGGETLVMAFTGFAEEHGLDAAAGTQRFFDKPGAFNADESVLCGQAAAESQAELFEPAIVTASKERGLTCGANIASGFSGRGHHRGG
jgi:hypothetical protein